MIKYLIFSILFITVFVSCKKNEEQIPKKRADTASTIYISDDIIIKDSTIIRDTIFNYNVYENFLRSLINSNRFIFVPLNEFESALSSDKVVIAMRHDIDYDIPSALRFARREFKLGIRATYFLLNTADYYGITKRDTIIRNPDVLKYILKLQNEYKHEIGWHNDLVTQQIVYNFDIKKYLTSELSWLRGNGIRIDGSVYHGSEFCYKYLYLNSYIWRNSGINTNFPSFDSVLINNAYIKIKKFVYSDFGLSYEGSLKCDYFFADVFFFDNKRWNMSMFDWNSLKPGDKVIILTHPALWD